LALPSGKILTAELSYNAETDEWHGHIEFDKRLMPMDLHDGLSALTRLTVMARNTRKNMIQEGEDLAALGLTRESFKKADENPS
jgi:hypothetical protein